MAFEWLISNKHYTKEDILFQPNNTPDFLCKDGNRYEVKYLYINKIVFSNKQVKKMKDSDVVLVFSDFGFVKEFLWKDRNISGFKISISDIPKRITIHFGSDQSVKKLRHMLADYNTTDEAIDALYVLYETTQKVKFIN